MALIGGILDGLFGGGRNVIRDTAEVFRVNAEQADARASAYSQAALQQFAAEFAVPRVGLFDRMMDGINRLPRPMLAFGTIGLFAMAMIDPLWFAARMQGIALVPEPLWWLMGAIVSFYFGARHQAKGQAFQTSIAQTLARAPQITRDIKGLEGLRDGASAGADQPAAPDFPAQGDNPALAAWRAQGLGAAHG